MLNSSGVASAIIGIGTNINAIVEIIAISFIVVMIKEKWRLKLVWLGIVFIIIFFQQLTASWLAGKSFLILISRHQALFDQANAIMVKKSGDHIFWSYDHKDSKKDFTDQEILILEKLKTEAKLTYISKDSVKIFYETYGFLDARGGVSYFYKDRADHRFTKINGRWYY